MPERRLPGETPPGAERREEAEAQPNVSSTIGTGSVLGLGCLALVILFVVAAVAFRLLGGSW